jgi:DNA-binding beta-propeller fold protein YncE
MKNSRPVAAKMMTAGAGLALILAVAVLASPPAYRVLNKIKIGGLGRWDYVFVDGANHRLYISHGAQTDVLDTDTEKVVGTIAGTNGVHGIAIAADLGKGFTSDGADNDVSVFDLKTLMVLSKVKTGLNPDAIIYEPVTHRVFTFNGRSSDATAIDAQTGAVIAASIPVGGKPEFAQVDGKGHIYDNIEDKAEIIELDAKTAMVTKRYSIAPCASPSGLAISPKGLLFSVCGNKMMIVSDPAAGKVLSMPAIGGGPDGVAFDGAYAFSANGLDGTITVVEESTAGEWNAVATIPTQRSARTIGADPKAHKLYLPAAEFGPPIESKDGKTGRGQILPDSFEILVVGR